MSKYRPDEWDNIEIGLIINVIALEADNALQLLRARQACELAHQELQCKDAWLSASRAPRRTNFRCPRRSARATLTSKLPRILVNAGQCGLMVKFLICSGDRNVLPET